MRTACRLGTDRQALNPLTQNLLCERVFLQRFGSRVATAYSVLTIVLYGFLYLGTTLFWGAYAVNALFAEQISFLGSNPVIRIMIMMVALTVIVTMVGMNS